jgi:hypothetical protein
LLEIKANLMRMGQAKATHSGLVPSECLLLPEHRDSCVMREALRSPMGGDPGIRPGVIG